LTDQILLVLSSSNWADEFDTKGFALITEPVWEEHLRAVQERIFLSREPLDEGAHYGAHVHGFGTNEGIAFPTFKAYKTSFKTVKVTKEETDLLRRLFKVKVNKTLTIRDTYGIFADLYPGDA